MRRQTEQTPARALQITPWERQALQLLANGDTPGAVAQDLGLSTLETEVLLTRLFAVMGATSQAEAVTVARKRGLLMAERPALKSAEPSSHGGAIAGIRELTDDQSDAPATPPEPPRMGEAVPSLRHPGSATVPMLPPSVRCPLGTTGSLRHRLPWERDRHLRSRP